MTTINTSAGPARASRKAASERRMSLLRTAQGAELLGLSSEQFLSLMCRHGIVPEATYGNRYRPSGPRCPLWPPEAVRALAGSPDVAAAQERRRTARDAKARKGEARRAALEARYPAWRDALPDAAEACFALNRYAKHATCSEDHRDEIYRLKGGLVRVLYLLGLAAEVKRHVLELDGLECWGCDGVGTRWDGDDCYRCGGTGWYRKQQTRVFVAFRFQVGGRAYCWHQPGHLVNWPYEVTAQDSAWEPDGTEKPVPIPASRFADAKALVGWVVARHEAAQGA